MRRFIVASLERWCSRLHFITHHYPWLWLPIRNRHCLLAHWSFRLEDRWQTGAWTVSREGADDA